MPGNQLNAFYKEFGRKPTISLSQHVYLTLAIKCPLFVQLFLAEQNFKITAKRPPDELEAYLPTEVEIGSPDLTTNKDVSAYFEQTTEALLLNQKAFKMDQCDSFVTQILTPISSYNTLIVSGSLNEWIKLVGMTSLPAPIEAYRSAIHSLMSGEWPNINDLIRVLQ